jgi:hypothetical protein
VDTVIRPGFGGAAVLESGGVVVAVVVQKMMVEMDGFGRGL